MPQSLVQALRGFTCFIVCDIALNTRVTSLIFNPASGRWTVGTEHGEQVTATFCIMAVGCLSTTKVPEFKGLGSFKGPWYHTGAWPDKEVDFTGQRVAVIGTGSSAIQSIPILAARASRLFVFQRTPNFSIPAHNSTLELEYQHAWKSRYGELRAQARSTRGGILAPLNDKSAMEATEAEREREYEARWARGGLGFLAAFNDLLLNRSANDTAADFVRRKIRAIVHDPAVARKLLPSDHPIGAKRICVDTGYYDAFNRSNVELIDLRESPIDEITPAGIRTHEAEYVVDSIVFATGFDAMTGSLTRFPIRGSDGTFLAAKWAAGPRTYLGLMTAGFPNLFLITGPGSPSVLSNMIVSIEQHVDWIADCLAYMRRRACDRIEALQSAEDAWIKHGDEVAQQTLYPSATSWYMGANIPGKPRMFMPYAGGVDLYRQICDGIAAEGYKGFAITSGSAEQPSA